MAKMDTQGSVNGIWTKDTHAEIDLVTIATTAAAAAVVVVVVVVFSWW